MIQAVKFMAYRGIAYKEAIHVMETQKYEKDERRNFQDGLATKGVFGSGIYFINDIESVTFYAFCHAEMENDLAAVLTQQLSFDHPLILSEEYGEVELRQQALDWKNPDSDPFSVSEEVLPVVQRMGDTLKEYVLSLGHDGIIYRINDQVTYYIAYYPERQIEDIQVEFVFDINELKKSTGESLRQLPSR